MSVTEPVPYRIRPATGVFTPLEEETVYFRQILRGNVIIGGSTRGPAYPDLCRAYVRPENTLSQLKHIRRLAPALGRLNIIPGWSGIEGYLPDRPPLLGPRERVSGRYSAFGFNRAGCLGWGLGGGGFGGGGGGGGGVAEVMQRGTTAIPLGAYRIGRFAAATAAIKVTV